MEPEEDVRSALNRELQEETALSVKIERLVGIYSDPTFQTF
jgi:ADP-ribose pyrophosphatase YjhB (NUDIX family)